tara:strand:- start:258 stop:776 length:519 start_codon:yes stop_codon:yes gene_type:complete
MAKKKKIFTSKTQKDLTWFKSNSQKWNRSIGQVGVLLEDEIHQGKNGENIVLKKGSKVIIDDIRGRIIPQYRVKDSQGKTWFVSALNIEVEFDESQDPNTDDHLYRGGVRHDGSEPKGRYTVDKTTEEEIGAKLRTIQEANAASGLDETMEKELDKNIKAQASKKSFNTPEG